MDDLRSAEVDFITIGQYLQPSVKHHPLSRYYKPDEFKDVVEFDKKIRDISKDPNMKNYTHRSCKPLDEVEFNKEDNQLDMFNNECDGVCGI